MWTSIFRRRAALATAAVLVALCAGCSEPTEPASGGPQIPALRFAGVDLSYALERVAAEAGLVLALDEISPRDQTPDLALYRVDLDLPAGSVVNALRELRRVAGGFDFELHPGVIYVRSQLAVTATTPIDQPVMTKTTFDGEIEALIRHISAAVPGSYVTQERLAGGPRPPTVSFEIADKSTIKDVLVQYAAAGKVGWTLRRAGHVINKTEKGYAIIGTSIEIRAPRNTTVRRPRVYMDQSTIGALADLSARLDQPMVVFDRSVLFNLRGMLNYGLQIDPGFDLETSLQALAASGWGPDNYHFRYRYDDGIPVLTSNHYLFFLRGRDLMRAELLAGEFEGSLPELARWINAHQKNPNGEVLMGGEIVAGQPRGRIQVTSGMTVEQLLHAFAKSTRVSPYVVVLEMMNPLTSKISSHPNAWRGSYLQDLVEWKHEVHPTLPVTPSPPS